MKRIFSILISLVMLVSVISPMCVYATETPLEKTTSFVPGEEYVLVMDASKAYPNGVYVGGTAPYCLVAETYKEGMVIATPPATVEAGQNSLWRISYAKTTNTVTLWSDYAGKFLNMSVEGATLSDTPQELNAVIKDTSIQIYIVVDGTNYYLRFTRGTGAEDHGRWIVAANKNTTTFTLYSIQDIVSDVLICPMQSFVSGEQYILGRGPSKDKAGITMEYSVVAAPKENGLQYAQRPQNVAKAADHMWRITENADGTCTFYSDAAKKYLNLSAAAASLSDSPQNLNVSLSGRKMKIYTVIDGVTYYLRFTNALETGSAWHSGNLTTSNEFTLYAVQEKAKEYDNDGQTPLYSVACFADLHVDYGIQSWENPIRHGTVNAVNYLKDTLGGANVVLVGGDIVSNNDWNAAWTNENLSAIKDTVYNTLIQGSTDSVVLPITGNHDSEPGHSAGGTVYSGDWESHITESVGEFDAALYNSESEMNDLLCYRYSLGGMEFISVNTPYLATGDASTLYVSQAEWVAEQLEIIGKHKTVILQCHYPLDSEEAGVAEALDHLQETLADYPNVLYFYGHLHGSDSDYVWYDTSELVQSTGTATQNEDNSWTVDGTLTCHMGSMGYYKNQYQSGYLGADEPLVVQFLKMDFYEDHITFRYYNTGEKSGDPNVYEITSYTVNWNVEDHVEVIDEGSEATCTQNGLSEGKHCGICGEVLLVQKEILASGHKIVVDENGNVVCDLCDEPQKSIDVNGSGATDTGDLISMLQFLNEDAEINETLADVNGDGNISLVDVHRLLKILNQ